MAAAIAARRRRVVTADTAKATFGGAVLAPITPLDRIDGIVTGEPPLTGLATACETDGIEVIVAR